MAYLFPTLSSRSSTHATRIVVVRLIVVVHVAVVEVHVPRVVCIVCVGRRRPKPVPEIENELLFPPSIRLFEPTWDERL